MPRAIAFYLPQFHSIPENDAWWGPGFTEWTNVARARPLFSAHDHPRKAGVLGEYDLTNPEVYKIQTRLAREFGVDGFCMYFYWFDGKRLLEKPVEAWRESPDLLPYSLSWANESWTRRWDGKERDVLMPQSYKEGFAAELFESVLPHFRAPHYIKHAGFPVFMVHRVDLIPNAREFARELRTLSMAAGLPGIHLVAAETKPGIRPEVYGFDAVAEFPPVGANTLATAAIRPVAGLSPRFRGRIMSYEKLRKKFQRRRPARGFVRYPGVVPGWDNTARRGELATIYHGATPQSYGAWLQAAKRSEARMRGSEGFVFINAWNEWAEGAYLEPDATNGDAYLRATRVSDVQSAPGATKPRQPTGLGLPSPAQLRSISVAAAGSALALRRVVANRLSRLGR